MSALTRLFRLFLILAVILSGVESAVAQSEMAGLAAPAGGAGFELCGGDGTILGFDPQGHPVTDHHACPHCLAAGALAAALDAPPCAWTAATGAARAAVLPPPAVLAASSGTDRPVARGPPTRI
jgi:hypothetical protein